MAKTIFLQGLSEEKNIRAGFRLDFAAPLDSKSVRLHIAGRTFWKVWLDGKYLAAGPARAAHGYARLDEWELPDCDDGKIHRIAIEVSSQNRLGLQEETGECGFLYAVIEADGLEIACTDCHTPAVCLSQCRREVEPYSHARPYNELYDLDDDYYVWRTADGVLPGAFPVEEITTLIQFIDRDVPYPCQLAHKNGRIMSLSDVSINASVSVPPFSYETEEMLASVQEHPAIDGMKDVLSAFSGTVSYPVNGVVKLLSQNAFAVDWIFDKAAAGFVGCHFSVDEPSIVDILHTDRYDGVMLSRRPDGCNDVIRLYCAPGTYSFESFLPYFTRYVRITLRKGHALDLHEIYLREYQYADKRIGAFLCEDALLNRIFDASIDTFRANTVDVFMDCPGRERAGWLCDSFWSGRVEKLLFGDTSVNRAMLRNYVDRWKHYQDEPGFACCYPSGIGASMPTWSLFFILQLEEYLQMSGDHELVNELQEHIQVFLDSLSEYETVDGVLEDPPGWVFVDWSCANDAYHQKPISISVNAMYAAGLSSAARLYSRRDWEEKAQKIRAVLRGDGVPAEIRETVEVFPDVLSHDETGRLRAQPIYSETCQYYCYWTGVENPQTSPVLFDRVVNEYGPAPIRRSTDPRVTPADVFIGLFIRFDMLSRTGCYHQLREELKSLLGYMLDHGPGTLWELQGGRSGSRCHGFTSHAGVWLMRDFLGLHPANECTKEILIAPHPDGMSWAQGSTMTNDGPVYLDWHIDRQSLRLNVRAPDSYQLHLQLPVEWNASPIWIINGTEVDSAQRSAYLAAN